MLEVEASQLQVSIEESRSQIRIFFFFFYRNRAHQEFQSLSSIRLLLQRQAQLRLPSCKDNRPAGAAAGINRIGRYGTFGQTITRLEVSGIPVIFLFMSLGPSQCGYKFSARFDARLEIYLVGHKYYFYTPHKYPVG